tara:strand:+ start:675 stop:1550 length:876 start_codon:yes stop_codon:yes gene_type:complete
MLYRCTNCLKNHESLIDHSNCCSSSNNKNRSKKYSNKFLSNFTLEWNLNKTTQFENKNKKVKSSKNFYLRTGKENLDFEGKKVLDAGVGSGRYAIIPLIEGAEVWGVDFSDAYLVAAENLKKFSKFTSMQADIAMLPFASNQFDYIYTFGVIHHSPDPEACLKELYRVLKPGGELCVTVYPSFGIYYTSRFIRKITTRIPIKLLYILTSIYTILFYHLYKYLFIKHTLLGRLIPISTSDSFKEALLDTYDIYSPQYQHTFHTHELYQILDNIGFKEITPRPQPITMTAMKL